MVQIAILMTCHNRRDKTLKCLKYLFRQNGISNVFLFKVFLVDDLSTDGTDAQILEFYPEVKIIKGSGNLYWNRGMNLAWSVASIESKYDYYIWLNDDTYLFRNAILRLLKISNNNTIVGGSTFCSKNKIISYGGFIKNKLLLEVENVSEVDCLNGNLVLIPSDVFVKIGNLDPTFHHAIGDFDYTLRARKNGVIIKLVNGVIGICDLHPFLPDWQNSKVSLINRLRYLYSPLSGCSFPEFFIFEKRHYGLSVAIFHFFAIHMKAFFPELRKIQKIKI